MIAFGDMVLFCKTTGRIISAPTGSIQLLGKPESICQASSIFTLRGAVIS